MTGKKSLIWVIMRKQQEKRFEKTAGSLRRAKGEYTGAEDVCLGSVLQDLAGLYFSLTQGHLCTWHAKHTTQSHNP